MATTAPTLPLVLHLSLVVPGDLRDAGGEKLGRVDDLIVRLGGDEYPPVSGVVATVAGRQVYVPADQVEEIAVGCVTLRLGRLDLQHFQRRESEVLLKKDVLDRQLINIDGARLVRANEIELARIDGWYRVVGVDVSLRGLVRRLVPRALAQRVSLGTFLDWASRRAVHRPRADRAPARPAPEARAAAPGRARRPRRGGLAPPGRRDHGGGRPPTRSSRPTSSRSSRSSTGSSSSEERTDAQIAALLEHMEADDAADLVLQLDEERREPIVSLLKGVQRRRVRALLGYDPATAGGLMSPEFVCVYGQATVAEAIERVRTSPRRRGQRRLGLHDEHAPSPPRRHPARRAPARRPAAPPGRAAAAGAARCGRTPRSRRSRG